MAKPADEALLGRTIASKYAIEAFLGGGAMGAVYRARQIALEKTVAIKVMHRELATDAMFAGRFHREAKAASRLDHPNSIRVIDFGEEPDGLLYIAMEYVDGRDLFQVLHQDWPLSTVRIVELLVQVLAALAVAHDMGVIHRDLKPENIMVLRGTNDEGKTTDVVKVCDFGIAKITDPRGDREASGGGTGGAKLTTQGLVVGTPEYMSPEQGRGEPLDVRSDLYSMGIILYHLITGRTPFDAESALGIVLKHVTDEPQPPHEINPAADPKLQAICLKAIRKRREDRYQTAREMRADLRAVLDTTSALLGRANTELALPTSPSTAPPPRTHTSPTFIDTPRTSPSNASKSAPSASKVTPLGTEAVTGAAQKRSPLAFVALVALLVGGGGAYYVSQHGTKDTSPPSVVAQMVTAQPPPSGVAYADPPPQAIITVPSRVEELHPPPLSAAPSPKTTGRNLVPDKPAAPLLAVSVAPPTPSAAPPTPPVAATTIATAPPPPAIPPPPVAPPPPAAPAFVPANAKVLIGTPSVNGGPSASSVRNAIHARHARIVACYHQALHREGPTAGAGKLHIETDDAGFVTDAKFSGPPSEKVGGDCIAAAAKGIKIPNVDTGTASADIPLTFTLE